MLKSISDSLPTATNNYLPHNPSRHQMFYFISIIYTNRYKCFKNLPDYFEWFNKRLNHCIFVIAFLNF